MSQTYNVYCYKSCHLENDSDKASTAQPKLNGTVYSFYTWQAS
jgi:hypothetical protein